jgi:methyltransferase (TIGR00027 family)
VRRGEPAGTAEAVALVRAIETARPSGDRLFSDPHANAFLGVGARVGLALAGSRLLRPAIDVFDRIAYGQRAFVLARTALIDAALAAALTRGVAQVLILGAGYDSRAYRIPGIERARVFEVDHPDTQARKRELLGRQGTGLAERVTFVSVDFDRQSLAERLEDAGFRRGALTFVIWEGVSEYLRAEAVDATLAYLARATAPGSEIVFTYLDLALLDGTRDFRGGKLHLAAVRRGGEPFTFGIDPGKLGAFLADRGFELLDDPTADELARRHFEPRGRRERSNEYQRVARARVAGATP